jgi:hypothetical protein
MASHATDKPRDLGNIVQPLVTLYALEATIVVTCYALYKASAPNAGTSISGFAIVALAGALSSIAIAAFLIVRHRRAYRSLAVAAVISLVSTVLALSIAESVVRVLARSDDNGTTIANLALRPTWPEVVEHNRRLIQRDGSNSKNTYFVYDPDLGWVVGPSRQGADGLYASSTEGIRSAKPGISFADTPAKDRVALIGDSNAFSLEVPFEDSLGSDLAELLGDDVQVLNFGVDGYGIDQIYLRYQRDVRSWKPKVVLVVFIEHDLMRTMAVYPFISFGWSGYLVKPRFDIKDDQLEIINRPLPTPEAILHAAAPSELSNIEYDPGYMNADWSWRFDRGPMLLRLLTSLSPRWPNQPPLGHADTVALNERLLRELIGAIERDGAEPLLVLLPRWSGSDDLAKTTLGALRHPYLDMRACLLQVPEEKRRVPSGAHYTKEGNQAIAQCALASVECALGRACK